MLTYEPALHDDQAVHDAWLLAALKEFAPQDAQVRLAVALPPEVTYCPGLHVVHAVHAVAEDKSWSYVPEPQEVFGVLPPGQNVPAAHALHCVGLVVVLGAVCSNPAAHDPCARQDDWFEPLEYVPAPQLEHTRSLVVEAGVDTYVPATQLVQALHEIALGVLLKVPAAHVVHERFVVAEPAVLTN